jgi:predicted dehydrogenase
MKDKEKRGDVVALCDTRPDALERYEKIVNLHLGHGTKHYTDFNQMLEDPGIDAVIISTPDYLHHYMAVEALNNGKHVFLEKPVGVNLEQMVDVLRAAKESKKILEIGYVLRYSPFYIQMKEIIDSGKIGRPMFVQAMEEYYGAYHFNRGWWRKKANTGGIMVQKICHDMDLHCWMFGKPVRVAAFDSINEFKPGGWDSDAKVCSECKNRCPYYCTKASRTYSDECVYNGDHDVADNAQVIVEFENGVNLSMGMTFFNSHGQDDRHWKVIGSKGEISGRLSEQLLRFDKRFDNTGTKSFLYQCAPPSDGHGGGDEIQMIEFLNALSENREAKAGLKSAYWSSVLVMAAQLSADSGEVVYIEDVVAQYPFPE